MESAKITKLQKQNNTKIIYSMRIATELIKMGHTVLITKPNIKNPKYMSWVFVLDDTLERDLEGLKGGARIGK